MLRVIGVRAIALALAHLAICGDAPTCETAVRGAVRKFADPAAVPEKDIADAVKQCLSERWSPEVRTCVSKASTPQQVAECIPVPQALERFSRPYTGVNDP